MYAIERIRIIRRYLEENGQVQVHALSDLLGVSEVTVRRDLERLESEGWLTRTHGGAVINRPESVDPLVEALEQTGDDEAGDEIASLALRMVEDGDVVMLTSGPVNTRLAARLEERRGLTVLTNDPAAALRVSMQDSNRVVLLGGDMDNTDKALYGSMALANLGRFFVGRLFIEVDGINDMLQMTVRTREKADLILGALELADQAWVVCPSPRFGSNAFNRLGDIRLAKGILTDTELSEDFKSRIFNADIPLYTTVAAYEGSR